MFWSVTKLSSDLSLSIETPIGTAEQASLNTSHHGSTCLFSQDTLYYYDGTLIGAFVYDFQNAVSCNERLTTMQGSQDFQAFGPMYQHLSG
jgi:hypothetical protein